MSSVSIPSSRLRSPALVLLVVLASAALLRLPGLADAPNWYGDEGFYVQTSWQFIHGDRSVLAIDDWTFLSLASPTPPLYHVVLGFAQVLFGHTLLVGRAVSVLLGLLTVWLAYRTGRLLAGNAAGLLGAAFIALLPLAATYGRMALSQNLAAFLILLSGYLGIRFVRERTMRRLATFVVVTGLAAATTFFTTLSVGLFLPVFLLFTTTVRKALLGVALASLPLLLVFAWVIVAAPAHFFSEAASLLSGVQSAVPASQLLRAFSFNVASLFLVLTWLPFLAAFGLLAIRSRVERATIGGLVGAVGAVVLWQRSSFGYEIMHFLPLLAVAAGIGVASIPRLCAAVVERLGGRPVPPMPARLSFSLSAFVSLVFLIPLLVSDVRSFQNGFPTDTVIDRFSGPSLPASEAAAWVNDHRRDGDITIVPGELLWLVRGNVTDVIQLTIAERHVAPTVVGHESPPYVVTPPRWRFLPTHRTARFLVAGPLTDVLVTPPTGDPYRDALEPIYGTWPTVATFPPYRVLENPSPIDATVGS